VHAGGFGFRPVWLEDGSNITFPVFNWHPLCMFLALLVCSEAITAYRGHPYTLLPRCARRGAARALIRVLPISAALL